MFYYAQTLKFSNMESYPNHLLKIYQNHAQPYLRYQYQIDPRGPWSGIGGLSVYRGSNLTHHLSDGSVVVDIVQVRE
jgi:hypothetical protein